jgi:multicomponent Na+:H+ antiporter subunit D
MVATAPVIAVLYLLPALSLAGIPPFSGFAAKFGLFAATARAGEWEVLAVAVLVSLLTLFSIFKVWIAVFWSPAAKTPDGRPIDRPATPAPVGAAVQRLLAPLLMIVPTALLATMTLAIGVAAGPLYDYSDRAAADLLDPAHYIDAVLHP